MACKIHTYLLLEYNAVARYMEHIVGCWSEGVCWLQGRGLWLRWFTPFLGYAPAYTQQLCANTWIIVMVL